jgi:hypothetical protein
MALGRRCPAPKLEVNACRRCSRREANGPFYPGAAHRRGPIRPLPGRDLALHIGELRVLSPPGFDGQEFLAVSDVRVRIGWLDALRGRVRLRSIEASDIGQWLERSADGRNHWDLAPPRDLAASDAAPR